MGQARALGSPRALMYVLGVRSVCGPEKARHRQSSITSTMRRRPKKRERGTSHPRGTSVRLLQESGRRRRGGNKLPQGGQGFPGWLRREVKSNLFLFLFLLLLPPPLPLPLVYMLCGCVRCVFGVLVGRGVNVGGAYARPWFFPSLSLPVVTFSGYYLPLWPFSPTAIFPPLVYT